MLFGGAMGALYFKAESPEAFKNDAIITFASEHNWHFVNRVQFREKDFQGLLNEEGQVKRFDYETYYNQHIQDYEQEEEAFQAFEALRKKSKFLDSVTVASQFPWWIKQDCAILSFDTGNRASLSSHVVINGDGTEMAVYYNGVR